EHGLANAGAAEQADLAALGVRRQQVDDLNTRLEDFRFRRLFDVGGGWSMDRAQFGPLDGARFVHRLADNIHNPAQGRFADWHDDRAARVRHGLSANETFGGVHGDGAHGVFAQVLRDFQNQAVAVIVRLERIQNGGKLTVELHVDDGARNLP